MDTPDSGWREGSGATLFDLTLGRILGHDRLADGEKQQDGQRQQVDMAALA